MNKRTARILGMILVFCLLITAFADQSGSWTCPSCGSTNAKAFCTNCGSRRPADWTCLVCGTVNGADAVCRNCGNIAGAWSCDICVTVNGGIRTACWQCGNGRDAKEGERELRSATIRTVGDFIIHDTIFKSAKRLGEQTKAYEYDFAPMLSYVRNYIGNADFTVTNVDGCLGGKDAYKYGYSGYPQFNTPEYIVYALKDCGVDMLTLANNHMLDGWYDGLQKTIANVDKVGLRHIGANKSLADKNAPYIVEINGIKVGFMNYTEDLNSMDQQKSLDARALEFGVNALKNSDCAAYAATLRAAGADVIVAFMHWGTEYQSTPDSDQEYYADMLVTAGVDVIMGGNPHVVQPAKWLTGTNQFGEQQKTLCVYSIGNFLSDQRGVDTSGGVIFDFTIQEQADGTFEIVSPGYMPTWVWRTGSDDSDYNYYVLPTQNYLKTRPAQMSNSDYEAMLNNYNSVLKVMQKGVGSLITE